MIDTVNDIAVSGIGTIDLLRPLAEKLAGKQLFVVEGILDEHGPKYDALFLNDATQVQAARSRLRPGGVVIVAGQDKASLFAGAGRTGFSKCSFYYPFPDMQSPSVLLSEAAFVAPELDLGNLMEPLFVGAGYPRGFIRRLLKKRLIAGLGDHVLAVLADDPYWLPDPDVLCWTFNPGRTNAYKKMNTIYRSPGGALRVRRQPYDPEPPSDEMRAVRQVLVDEDYTPGRLYSLELADVLSVAGWSAADIASWAGPWIDLMRQQAMATGTGEWLEGKYLDLVPFNLVSSDGALVAIDQEWLANEYLPVHYIFFRGLYHSLARIGYAAPPAPETPVNLYGLCLAVASRYFDDAALVLESFLSLEPYYFGKVFDGNGQPPGDTDVLIRQDLAALDGDVGAPQTVETGRLYPLTNLNFQIFVEGPGREFSEETSAMLQIALTTEPKIFRIALPHFTNDITRLRIDPSDHCGLVNLHAIHVRSEEEELFHWTPSSGTEVRLDGVLILNAAPGWPNPLTVLLSYDPMLVFSLPAFTSTNSGQPVVLEVEVSMLGPGVYETLRSNLASLCDLLN